MQTFVRRIALVLTVALCVAAPAELQAQKKKNRDVITRDEIQQSGQKDLDLLAAIRSLRPHFLAPPRGIRSMGGSAGAEGGVAVYVGSTMQTGLDALLQIMAADVEEVKYLEPSKAQNEYGIRAAAGAIVVKLHAASTGVAAKRDSS
jgi:hypothetical protein